MEWLRELGEGPCWICGRASLGRRLAIDHDHVTGRANLREQLQHVGFGRGQGLQRLALVAAVASWWLPPEESVPS